MQIRGNAEKSRGSSITVINTFLIFAVAWMLLFTTAQPGLAAIAPDVVSLTSITSALNTPVRLTSDSSGFLYISDPRNGGIIKLDSAGTYQSRITAGSNTLGIAVAASGDLLVSQGTSVAVYANGIKAREFGTFGRANGIAVTTAGVIFVVDSASNNVQAFNSDYSPRTLGSSNSFGGTGIATGQFRQPTGISYEKLADQLAVVDTRNGRVQFFSTSGVYQKSIGSYGAGPLSFSSPQAISFEYSADGTTLKRIYVLDAYQSTVQVMDGATGEFIRYIGNYGITQGKLFTPSDILFDKSSRLVVANGTGKLALFGVADPSTSPMLLIDTIPQATNLPAITLSGTTTGTSVTINGASATMNGSAWSRVVSLAAGVNTFTVVASNGTTSTTKTVSITASAPAANPVILTVTPIPSHTASAPLTVSGTTTAGSSVTINGTPASVVGTAWNATITLQQGLNTLKIVASKSGMNTTTVDISITLDTTVPILASRLPSPGSVFSTPLQTISGTVSSSNATTIVLTVNGTSQSVTVTDGTFSIPVILAGGNNAVSLHAIDSNGATSPTLQTTLTYNPLTPRVMITTPANSVSGAASYRLTGTAPAGSSITVNGSPAIVNGTNWSADVQLSPGINNFEVTATPAAGGAATTATTSVAYSPGLPNLSITSPPRDVAVGSPTYTLSGTATPGSIVTARINGVPTTVTTSASGLFAVVIPDMTATGAATAVINVTDPVSGTTASSTRSFVYEAAAPKLTMISSSPLVVTATAGSVLIAQDKNGPVGTVTSVNGIPTLDLTGINYDAATLNIQSLSPAGLSSRNGDMNNDGKVDLADALKALRGSAKLDTITFSQTLTGDVAPLVNFESQPDGVIGLDDAIVILNKLLGLIP